MAHYALIGGRSIPHLTDFTLEEKIFSHLNIRPNQILFIPLAAYPKMDDAIRKFKALVPKNYTVDCLTNFQDKIDVALAIHNSDVIYFSGGCAEELVRLVREYKIDHILEAYKDTEKLFIGISAGAILFSKFGMGDRYSYKDKGHNYNYQMVEGLGILPITICPHYDHNGLDCYNEEVKNYPYDGYAIEDDTAILFQGSPIIFKQDNKKSVYLFDSNNTYLMSPIYEVKK
ncbi:MAG: Type 1 glutamine amidotransferase-like domain-containing protein [Anaeroplasmataceae bacterium]|nr:Type 1 glutamine amidotransferase-like domain-containing protein [Anaeroplasmataceae bacterium]MDE6241502.1 Type 1 glutamine amidotransferase-like domain-containing protein [Anaeroplasmataceae bacterium]